MKTYLGPDIDMYDDCCRFSSDLCIALGSTQSHHLVWTCHYLRLCVSISLDALTLEVF